MALGYFISALTGDLGLANAFSGLIIMPLVLLGGFYLQDHPIPGYLVWIKEISMFNWGYKLMVINQFSGKVFECPPAPAPSITRSIASSAARRSPYRSCTSSS